MHNKLNVSMTRGLQFGAVVTLAVACSATTDQNPGGSAGAPPVASAGSASGGRSSGGAPSAAAGMPTIPATGGGGASSAMGGGGSGSAPTQAGAGAPSIAGAPSGGTTSVAGSGSGGSAGREAIILRCDHPRATEIAGDRPDFRLEIGVDRETGVIVRLIQTIGGRVARHAEVTDLAPDAPLPPAAFEFVFPSGTTMLY